MCRDRKIILGGGAGGGDANVMEKGGTVGSVQQNSSFPYIYERSEFPHIIFDQNCVIFSEEPLRIS